MLNLKSQRGSITMLILVSCLFFLASVVGIQMHLKSKEMAVDEEYMKIKESYNRIFWSKTTVEDIRKNRNFE